MVLSSSGDRKLVLSIAILLAGVVIMGSLISSSSLLSKPSKPITGSPATNSGSASIQVGQSYPYDCSLPAAVSDLSCDTLPTGFVIPPKLPNAPPPSMPSGMTPAAWALYQKTYGTGVCTPNVTPMTDPFDCSVQGNLMVDPFTGRPGMPVSVCQVSNQEALAQAQEGAGQG